MDARIDIIKDVNLDRNTLLMAIAIGDVAVILLHFI